MEAKKAKGQGFQFSLPKTNKPKEVPPKPLVVIKPAKGIDIFTM